MAGALRGIPRAAGLGRAALLALAAGCLTWLLIGPDRMGAMPGTMGLPLAGFLLACWAPMAMAMTLPLLLLARAPARGRAAVRLGTGYAVSLLAAGILAYGWLRWSADLSLAAPKLATGLGVAILLGAAAYHFTSRPARALEAGWSGCAESCAALMAALLVVGAMSPPAMLAMVLIPLAERASRGLLVARLVGFGLAAIAAFAILDPAVLAGLHATSAEMMSAPGGGSPPFFCALP
ncbi:MAG: hypothetical protein AB7V58_12445 [Solirubrobacterales bacterium]